MRLVYLSLAWTIGIILAASFSALIPLFWLVFLGLAVFLALMAREHKNRWYAFALVALALGGYRYQLVAQSSDIAQYNAIGGATIEGLVVAEPDIRDESILIRLEAERIFFGSEEAESSGMVLVTLPRSMEIAYGDRLRVTGRMAEPAEYDNFSYADYLARQGVFSLMSNASVEILGRGEGDFFFQKLFELKTHLQNLIAQALPEPQAALLTGILLGNERGIDANLNEAFSRVGAAHIIAISGYNMSLIAQIFAQMLQPLKREKLAAAIGIVVLALYTLLVGANPAVIRAAVMSSLLIIAPLLKRKTYLPASLGFVAMLFSLFNPLVLWDISFQLSFFAVLGISLFNKFFEEKSERLLRGLFPKNIVPSLMGILNQTVIVSLAALSLTLPLTILYFQRLSLVMLFVNMLVLPVQSWLLILGGLALMVALISPSFAQILFWLDMILLGWTIGIVRLFAALPFADTVISIDSRLIWLFIAGVMGGAMVNATKATWAQRLAQIFRKRPVTNTLLFLVLGTVILMALIQQSRPDGKLHLWWLDVGHSNTLLIQSPNGAQILVDGGHFPSRLLTALGDRMPFYDRTIEMLIITQPDEWDVSALTAVLNRYDVPMIVNNGQPNQSAAIQALEAAMGDAEVISLQAGYSIAFSDGLRLEILHPQSEVGLEDNLNDGAMVLRLTYGERSFLLTSDISQEGQVAILDAGQIPYAELMQLPQHAAARSINSAFLEAVQPQVLVLQADAANRRGEPSPDTLALFEDLALYRTDEEGTLHFWTDGVELWQQGTR